MIYKEVTRQHIFGALTDINKNGVPANRRATKYSLYHNGKTYPPKYVLSVATKIALGRELEPSQFNGGRESNNFLSNLGFTIREGNNTVLSSKSQSVSKKQINVCTAVIQTQFSSEVWDDTKNSEKIELLSRILKAIDKDIDILILPAGFMNSKNKKPKTIFEDTQKSITDLIKKHQPKLFICFGIDGRSKADQIAIAINKTGMVAIARKFHHMDNTVYLADNAFTIENEKQRYFSIKGKRAYLAVCYDIFGISHNKLLNKSNCDFIIGVIHGFGSNGGDSDFARKGLAGASKQWNVHSYASAVFSNNRNPTNWTSGVKWMHGNASVKEFTYDEIRIESGLKKIESDLGTIYLRHFSE